MYSHYLSIHNVNETPPNSSRWQAREKCVLTFGVLSIVLSIVAITAMTVMAFVVQESMMKNHQTNKNPIACVACAKLRKDPTINNCSVMLTRDVNELKDNDETFACAYDTEQMPALLTLVMEKQGWQQDLPEYEPNNITFSEVSAHKQLFPPTTDREITVPYFEPEKLVTAQLRRYNDPLIEHVRGVEVHTTGFLIKHSGLYLIYSSLHFSPRSSLPCKEFAYKSWGHYVEKFVMNRPGRTGYIMKAFHTCCDQCTNDHESSFLSGLFHLHKGDMIRVLISGHGLVLFQRESSFVGLVMFNGSDNEKQKHPIIKQD